MEKYLIFHHQKKKNMTKKEKIYKNNIKTLKYKI